MRQKFQDLSVLLKKDRKTQVIAIAVVAALMFLIFAEPNRGGGIPKRQSLSAGTGAPPTDERYDDLIMRFSSQLESVGAQLHETSLKVDQIDQRGAEYEKRTAEIFKRILERIAETEAAVMNASLGGSPGSVNMGDGSALNPDGTPALGKGAYGAGGAGGGMNGSQGGAGAAGGAQGGFGAGALGGNGGPGSMAYNGAGYAEAGLDGNGSLEGLEPDAPETFGFEDPQVVPPAPPAPKKLAIVGAGDSVRVKLLAGVNAPTDGTPYPVVFSLDGDVIGPDGSLLPLGEARLIAAAQGSLTDRRALFRLSSLNIRLPNGKRKIMDIDGWIVGEDGKRGMEGLLIDPLSKIIGGVAIAGGVQGLGYAISQEQITTYRDGYGQEREVVTGDTFNYAAGKALQGASTEWAGIIRERANMLVPHVEVLSGREGTAVFSQSFTIDGLFEQLEEDEDSVKLASLD